MFLKKQELQWTYYPKVAVLMNDTEVDVYLMRANAWAQGIIGGQLPEEYVDDGLKTAVAMAFEIFSKGEIAQIDEDTGNITEAAPAGFFPQKKKDPLDDVAVMLQPYKALYASLNSARTDRGVKFL